MTDSELVLRVLDGDADAYAALVERHYDRCARYAYRMLGSRDDAEDALQEAFLRAYRALGRYEERDAFGAWLMQILVNECRTQARRRGRRERVLVRDEEALANAAADAPYASDGLDEVLQAALAALDPRLREAFLLKHVEELSYDEMAAITGAGVSALKMRVKRACDWLRPRLEEIYHA